MVINAVTFRVGVCHEEMGLGVDLDIIADYTTLCWFISWKTRTIQGINRFFC